MWEVGECVGWTRMLAAAGIIGLQQRSLTSPWTDGQTWSPKASIPRKPRYNSHPLSPSPTPSLYHPLGSLGLAKPAFAHRVYDFNRMEIRRESRVIRSYFPRNAAELASAYSVPVFFFYLSKCHNAATRKLECWFVILYLPFHRFLFRLERLVTCVDCQTYLRISFSNQSRFHQILCSTFVDWNCICISVEVLQNDTKFDILKRKYV